MSKNDAEQRFLRRCLKNLEKNPIEESIRSTERFDFNNRTDEILVPSRWVTRLDEANAVNEQFELMREKLDDSPKISQTIDREKLFCSSALHKMKQNAFYQRLNEHEQRWVRFFSSYFVSSNSLCCFSLQNSITLIGELASQLPKPTSDPREIEKQLYKSLSKKN